jgi:hypothetical protein
MKQLGALSNSINRLADSFEGVAKGAKAAQNATKGIGASTAGATALIKKFATEQEKLIANAATLQRVGSAGSRERKQAITTETRLLADYIKKTNDLSVLEKRRDSKGRFGYGGLSAQAVNSVKAQLRELSKPIDVKINLVTTTNRAKIKAAVDNLISPDDNMSATARKRSRAARYADLEAAFNQPMFGPADRYAPRFVPGSVIGYGSGGNRGGSGGGRGGAPGIPRLGPRASDISGVDRLVSAYTRLGHVLFQLQYSTLTIFGATGIGLIMKQADAYISLRNTVAQTSASINELGQNMDDVFKISKQTFTDPQANGRIFSLLERYSKDLGFDRSKVSNTTQAIAAAFSASPGTKESKSAAQYQFIQGLQSNRFGGDELRSVLEGAPLVGQLLSKYIAKNRGMAPGSMIDLRAQKGLKAEEIAKAASDPAFLKEAMGILQNRTRTFGDVIQLAQIRMLEYTGKAQEATGLFGTINQTLAKFLGNDVIFDKFIKSIQFAAVALGTLGTIALTRAIPGLVSKALGPGITGAARAVNGASLASMAGGIGNASRVVASGIGSGITGARNAIGSARMLSAVNGGGLRGAGAVGLEVLGGGLSNILGLFMKLGKFLFGMGGIITVVVTVIALLVARFNSLLGQTKSGISIFTILKVELKKLFSAISEFPGVSFIVRGLQAIGGWIDKLLGGWAKKAAANRDYQEQAINDGFMGQVARDEKGKRVVSGKTRMFQIKDSAGKVLGYSDNSRDAKDRLRLYDANGKATGRSVLKAGETGYVGDERASLPGAGVDSKAKQMAERIAEFFRDINLQIADIQDTVKNSASYLEIEKPVKDSQKKILDIMNIDLKKYDGDIDKAIEALPDAIRKQIKEATKKLRAANIAKSIKEFTDSIRSEFIDKMLGAITGGMSSQAGNDLSFEMGKIRELIDKGGMFSTDIDKQKAVLEAMRRGDYAGARGLYNAGATTEGRTALSSAVSENRGLTDKSITEAAERQKYLFEQQVDAQRNVNKFFGEHRQLAQQIADIELKYLELRREDGTLSDAAIKAKEFELQQAKQLFDIEERRQKNKVEGLKSAIVEYYDSIKNVADQTKDIFASVFTSIEDGIVGTIMGDKVDWKSMGREILSQITHSFVQAKIMKPLINKLFPDLVNPSYDTIRAKFLEVGTVIGGGDVSPVTVTGSNNSLWNFGMKTVGGLFGNKSGSDLLTGGSSGSGNDWLDTALKFGTRILSSMFHSGGVAGEATSSRLVNPSVFRNAKYYHGGGIAGMPSLASNEVPAILQRGERILTQSQQAGISRGATMVSNEFKPNVTVNYTSSGKGSDSESDAKVIAEAVNKQVELKLNEFALKQKRDGGIFKN